MTRFKTTLLHSAALAMCLAASFAAMPARAESDNHAGASACPNGSDFGNRGVCNEAPAQTRPQQPAPNSVQPQPQSAPSAGPSRRSGNSGNDQVGTNNRRNDNGYSNQTYNNRGYNNRGYDNRSYGNYNNGYDRSYGGGSDGYDSQRAYPNYSGYPSYDDQRRFGYAAAAPYDNGVMGEEQIAYVLQQQGFSRIETVDYATGQYTIDARDPYNRPVRLRVSGQNGQIHDVRAR